jgi:hypothetical protein
VDKKILLLILLGVLVLPTVACAGDLPSMAQAVSTAATSIGGPLIIVGWIIAGILYLTSAGSPERMGTAKKAIVAAVVGTVLVLIAAGASSFVGNLFGL